MTDDTPKRPKPLLVEIPPADPDPIVAPSRIEGRDGAASRRQGLIRPDTDEIANAGDGRDRRPLRRSTDGPSPADAPPVDGGLSASLPEPRTMLLVSRLLGRQPSRLTRLLVNTGAALLTFLLGVATLRFFADLLDRYPLLGWIGIGLIAIFAMALLAVAWREYRAWSRFAAIDQLARDAAAALGSGDLAVAQDVTARLSRLYAPRPEMAAARAHVARHQDEAFEAHSLLALAETALLADLDQQARREIEAAARTVAATTALIPLALVDIIAALVANMRMIRRMAEIYGGRAGSVGGWRLARRVIAHLIATGAMAAGDDLIQTVVGGGVMARLSKRFGEGVVNGALTARLGIAAMEVCRPMPFVHQPRPVVSGLLSRGLKGLFGDDSARAS